MKSKIFIFIFPLLISNCAPIGKLIGGKKIFIPSRKGDPIASNAKIKKIKTKLGWFPKVTLKKGLKKLLKKNNI